jgi:hypothetical protein
MKTLVATVMVANLLESMEMDPMRKQSYGDDDWFRCLIASLIVFSLTNNLKFLEQKQQLNIKNLTSLYIIKNIHWQVFLLPS